MDPKDSPLAHALKLHELAETKQVVELKTKLEIRTWLLGLSFVFNIVLLGLLIKFLT